MDNPTTLLYLRYGLEATPIVLPPLLHRLTEAEADFRPDPERFTVREALAHLADWEDIWHERLSAILTRENPLLAGYDEGQLATDRDYAHADIARTLQRFQEGRQRLLPLLTRVSPEDAQRTGTHAERGPLRFTELVTLILGHDGYHLRQFAEWRQRFAEQSAQ